MMKKIVGAIVKALTKLVYRVKVNGKENIPEEGAALICPNHVHAMDGPSIIAHSSKRQINALVKAGMFDKPGGRWLAKTYGLYPIKQNSADLQAIKTALKVLKNKELLLIFPEGTRNGLKKGLKPKNGPIMIAIKAGVPIIPVGVKGTFKPFRKVIINIGKPIYYDNYKDKTTDKELMNSLTEKLMEEIIKLRDM